MIALLTNIIFWTLIQYFAESCIEICDLIPDADLKEFCKGQCESNISECIEECGLDENSSSKEIEACKNKCLDGITDGVSNVCNGIQASVINTVLLVMYNFLLK